MKKISKKDLLGKIEVMENESRQLRKDLEGFNRRLENLKWFVNLSDDPEKLNNALDFAQHILRVLEEKVRLCDLYEYE